MRSALLVKPYLPELIPKDVEKHQLPHKYREFFQGKSILGVYFLALGHQIVQVVPEEVALVYYMVEEELVMDDLPQPILVEASVVIVVLLGDLVRQGGELFGGV